MSSAASREMPEPIKGMLSRQTSRRHRRASQRFAKSNHGSGYKAKSKGDFDANPKFGTATIVKVCFEPNGSGQWGSKVGGTWRKHGAPIKSVAGK